MRQNCFLFWASGKFKPFLEFLLRETFPLKGVMELPGKSDSTGDENKRSSLTTLLFICVSLAILMKFLFHIEPVRQFFAGPGKFVFFPILLFLGYLATQRGK